jgi:6-phosphogluconate dehydrogenase
MPLLRGLAAKDKNGNPCTAPIGPGSSGHYTKMVHNGIEQGMMSAVAETWLLLVNGLGLTYEEAAGVFAKWNESGPLKDCFLVAIAADVNRAKTDGGDKVLGHVRDKVVQDAERSEGTGTWTGLEAVANHIPAATIVSAHLFRCASADLERRMANKKASAGGPKPGPLDVDNKEAFIDALHTTIYFCFLAAFAQGLNLLRHADKQKDWRLDYSAIMQVWRGGSIIAAEHIIDLLDKMYQRPDHDPDDVLSNEQVSKEMQRHIPAVKEVVVKAVQAEAFVPAISQSLEFFKYSTSTDLPTQFMEAQLDYFGEHMFDRKEGPPGKPETGGTHYEWKQAKGPSDKAG